MEKVMEMLQAMQVEQKDFHNEMSRRLYAMEDRLDNIEKLDNRYKQ